MKHAALGLWHCQFVDQEQSESEAKEYGEYDDMGMDRRQKASKTEFAGATLELRADGSYSLDAEDYNSSTGTWSGEAERAQLTQSKECTNGYEGLEYSGGNATEFTVAFKLNSDSHDGMDVLVLTFGRDEPKANAPASDGLVDRLLAIEDEDELYELLDEVLEGDAEPAAAAEQLWDAWVAGKLAADPESETYWLETQALEDERLKESGGFKLKHFEHALKTLSYDDDRDMFDVVEEMLVHLPEGEEAAPNIAPLIQGKWLEMMTSSRFMGGGLPEEFFERALMPQPAADNAARAHLGNSDYYTRFEAIEKLYPEGHADLPAVVLRYRGRGLLDIRKR